MAKRSSSNFITTAPVVCALLGYCRCGGKKQDEPLNSNTFQMYKLYNCWTLSLIESSGAPLLDDDSFCRYTLADPTPHFSRDSRWFVVSRALHCCRRMITTALNQSSNRTAPWLGLRDREKSKSVLLCLLSSWSHLATILITIDASTSIWKVKLKKSNSSLNSLQVKSVATLTVTFVFVV